MKIQRYELELYHCNGGDMEHDETGTYIEYEAFRAALDTIRSKITYIRGIDERSQGHNNAMRIIQQALEDIT